MQLAPLTENMFIAPFSEYHLVNCRCQRLWFYPADPYHCMVWWSCVHLPRCCFYRAVPGSGQKGEKAPDFRRFMDKIVQDTFPETNSLHLKMYGWNTNFLLGPGLFSGAMLLVSGRVVRVVRYNIIDTLEIINVTMVMWHFRSFTILRL